MQITKVQEQKNGYLVNDSIFVPNAQDNSDYQAIQKWIADGGVVEAFDYLAEAKLTKIAQLKANRNAALEKTWIASTAHEWEKEEEPKVFFEFSVKSTGIVLTEPHTIVFGALFSVEPIKYSCKIIEGENRREGYIVLNQQVAGKLSNHLRDDGTIYVTYANDLEAEINACTTIEEVESININFQ